MFSYINHNKSNNFRKHSHVTYHILKVFYDYLLAKIGTRYWFICLVVNSVTSLLCFHSISREKQFRRISACRLFLKDPWIMVDLFRQSVLLLMVSQFHQISWPPIVRHSAWERQLWFRTMPEKQENTSIDGFTEHEIKRIES